MPHFTVTRTAERGDLARLLAPRDDIVLERPAPPEPTSAGPPTPAPPTGDGGRSTLPTGDGAGRAADVAEHTARFTLAGGPFAHYERTVAVGRAPDGGNGSAVGVSETFDFRLPPGTWSFLLNPAVRHELRSGPREGGLPWWFPPQRPDARGATVLGLLATLSLVVGYHGTLLTQTMTFAADEFGAGSAAQGDALAAVRIGGVLAIGLGALADRRGRRLILSLALLICIGSTVLGAAAPNLVVLAATQSVNRGAWAAASLLLAIIAAEEMPAGARAYALSLLAMSGGLGAGIALWVLPVADIGPSTWRVLYVIPLLFLPVVARFGRLIPESRRFVRTHRNVALAGHYRRLALLAGTSFLFNVFMAPQSQFRNEFLRDDRGMSAAAISLFVIVTSTPATIGIVAGGRLADTRGRRIVGATAISVGTVLIALSFATSGVAMWGAALVGGIVGAAVVPAITVYGPELFPTSLRGRTNGIISMTAMGGSVVGLAAAGRLEEALGSFGAALAILAIGPMLMAAIVLAWFPETARRELEDLNPEDRVSDESDRGDASPTGLVARSAPSAAEDREPARE